MRKKTGSNSKKKAEKEGFSPADIAEALNLKVKGLNNNQIAKILEKKQNTVTYLLNQFNGLLSDYKNLDKYQEIRTNLLMAAEAKLLKTLIKDEVLEKASLNSIAYAFEKISKQLLLAQGKATQNVEQIKKVQVSQYLTEKDNG